MADSILSFTSVINSKLNAISHAMAITNESFIRSFFKFIVDGDEYYGSPIIIPFLPVKQLSPDLFSSNAPLHIRIFFGFPVLIILNLIKMKKIFKMIVNKLY